MSMRNTSYCWFINLIALISLLMCILLQLFNMIIHFNKGWSIHLDSSSTIIWSTHCIQLILSYDTLLSSNDSFKKLRIYVLMNELFELIRRFWSQFWKDAFSFSIWIWSFIYLFPTHSLLDFFIVHPHDILHFLDVINCLIV